MLDSAGAPGESHEMYFKTVYVGNKKGKHLSNSSIPHWSKVTPKVLTFLRPWAAHVGLPGTWPIFHSLESNKKVGAVSCEWEVPPDFLHGAGRRLRETDPWAVAAAICGTHRTGVMHWSGGRRHLHL